MPTTRPRHSLTEDDELAAAIDQALRSRPDLTRSKAIRELALAGARTGLPADDDTDPWDELAGFVDDDVQVAPGDIDDVVYG